MPMNADLLEVLACPKCRGAIAPVVAPEDGHEVEGLACAACGVVYPVREGIPVMLVEEAVPADGWARGARSVKE